MSEETVKRAEPLLAVLNALCTLNAPSTNMIVATTGLSPWVVKRSLSMLKGSFGVRYTFDRSGNSADGGVGHYVLTDTGVFDRKKVVKYFLPEGTK